MTSSLTRLSLASLLKARHQAQAFNGRARYSLDHFPGPRVGPRRGQGIEFDDLRPYFAGDDIRHIDWNVTARANQAYTRLYREEKEQTTTVVVDLRPAMFTGSQILKSVKAAELAASTLWHASQNGDRCSAVVFSAIGIRTTRPLGGHRGVLGACELICDEFDRVRDDAIAAGSGTIQSGLEQLLTWLQIAGRRTGLKLLFTGCDESGDNWHKAMKACGQQQNLFTVLLTDKLETSVLPSGYYRYKKGQNVAAVQLDTHASVRVATLLETQLQTIRSVFNDSRVPLIEIDSECSGVDFLSHLARKQII